jgi:hypothetical protein
MRTFLSWLVGFATVVLGLLACSSDSASPHFAEQDAGAVEAGEDAQVAHDAPPADVQEEVADTRPRLDVKVRGVGGHVGSSPSGVDCTETCAAQFDPGTAVTLTAKADTGYWFGGWLGDCKGTGTCKLTMNAAHAVSASFFLDNPPWDSSTGVADCQSAWGNQGDALSPCDKSLDQYVVVNKAGRNLAVCDQGANTHNFRIGLGFGPTGDKVQQGDGKTPEGVFYISALVPDSSFHLAFLLSYPDKADAERGLADGLISEQEKATIDTAQDACTAPLADTGLGGEIEIHGGDGSTDWTAGCIGIEDAEMDTLWTILEPGDTIVVLP